jgi:hypothetical protein
VIPSPTPPVLETFGWNSSSGGARPNRHNHPGESHVGPDQTVTVGSQQPVVNSGSSYGEINERSRAKPICDY